MSSPHHLLERNAELYWRYHEMRKKEPNLTQEQALNKVLQSPTSRYWVSLYEVYREILKLVHGRPLPDKIKPIRRKQIEDIYKVYQKLAAKPSFKDCSVFFIVQFAIAEPAPEFYLGYDRAVSIIQYMQREYDIEEIG